MLATGLTGDRIELVRGLVDETIPARMSEQIAVLRLDTDWYESSYHELIHLFPRLSRGGVC
jgi:O-methyltransferase